MSVYEPWNEEPNPYWPTQYYLPDSPQRSPRPLFIYHYVGQHESHITLTLVCYSSYTYANTDVRIASLSAAMGSQWSKIVGSRWYKTQSLEK